MSNWTLKELEAQLSKLEDEIAVKEEAADELRHEIWKLTPRVPMSGSMAEVLAKTNEIMRAMMLSCVANDVLSVNLLMAGYSVSDAEGAKIGATLRIKLPDNYTAVTK